MSFLNILESDLRLSLVVLVQIIWQSSWTFVEALTSSIHTTVPRQEKYHIYVTVIMLPSGRDSGSRGPDAFYQPLSCWLVSSIESYWYIVCDYPCMNKRIIKHHIGTWAYLMNLWNLSNVIHSSAKNRVKIRSSWRMTRMEVFPYRYDQW